jgi:hypothetical protein
MRFRDDPIEDSVGDGRFIKILVPFSDRGLGTDNGGSVFISIFEDL